MSEQGFNESFMNSEFQQLIRDLEMIGSNESEVASQIRAFQQKVWEVDNRLSSDRDRLIRVILGDLAYDLDFIDPEKSDAWKNEIRAALSQIFVISEANDAQITRMIQDMERPALEAARRRKRRFIAGTNGIKDDGI
jgi:hypothetical protein